MKHLCYVYIYEYKCLKDIELVFDCRYSYKFSKEDTKLSITKNEVFPTNFWGKSISSIAAIIGNNGTGKSTAMSFLLSFLVKGSACESLNGIIVFEQDGRFYFYGKDFSVVFDDKEVEQINSSIGLKDTRWKIPCFYHSGHFTPNVNNDPRNSYLPGSYFASDIVRLVEDLRDDSNENASLLNLPLSRYLNSHVAQNNYRICMMMSNKKLSDTITKIVKDFKWPRYVIIGINRSGATALESSLRNEKGKVIKEIQKVVEEKEKRFDNKTTKYSNTNVINQETEEFNELLQYDRQLLTIRDLKAPVSKPNEISMNNNMAKSYYYKGQYDRALECFEKALKAIISELGKEDLDVATIYNNVAIVHYTKGDYDKALEYYKKALAIREPKLGKDNGETFSTYYSIARMYYIKGEYGNALEYYNKLRTKSIFGQTKPVFLAIENNIARVYLATGDYDNALLYCKKAIDLFNIRWYNDYDEAFTYNNIARVYYAKGDYNKAIEFLWDVLKFDLDERDTAIAHNNIAWAYYKKGNYDMALESFKNAMVIRESKSDKEPLFIAKIYNNIAEVFKSKGDYEKSLEYYEKAKEIRESLLGKDYPETIKTYYDIAELYNTMGDYDKALEYYHSIESYYNNTTMVKEDLIDTPIPSFKTVFAPSSKDYYLSLLIYYNLLNIINDKWGWKNGSDIINEWQNQIQSTTPILEQLDSFINNSVSDIDKKKDLKLLYDILIEIQKLTLCGNNSKGNKILYIDCGDNNDNLITFGEKVLYCNKFSMISKFFELSYAQSLDSETILSSGEQELLNLFSRLYDAIFLRPNKLSDIKIPSLLMLDEAEIGFHPDWQRKYLKLVIDFIRAIKETNPKIPNFQIIISTHSPILLSDIPKCCINYLKTENKGTVMANGDDIGETFAENVFQLYRRSFFMNEGLVGEFARDKINKLEKRIQDGETTDVLNEIKMIGDDAIREFLMEKYLQKYPKDELIKYYERRIEQLKEQKNSKNE